MYIAPESTRRRERSTHSRTELAVAKKLAGKVDKGYKKIYCMSFWSRHIDCSRTHTHIAPFVIVFYFIFLSLFFSVGTFAALWLLFGLRAALNLRRLQLPNVCQIYRSLLS